LAARAISSSDFLAAALIRRPRRSISVSGIPAPSRPPREVRQRTEGERRMSPVLAARAPLACLAPRAKNSRTQSIPVIRRTVPDFLGRPRSSQRGVRQADGKTRRRSGNAVATPRLQTTTGRFSVSACRGPAKPHLLRTNPSDHKSLAMLGRQPPSDLRLHRGEMRLQFDT
jgi:hypothetical protein